MKEVYLDNNATTRPLDEVRRAVSDAMGKQFGNPSSAHSSGDRARTQMARARADVAQLIGAPPDSVIFTSGGTEANNLVLNTAAKSDGVIVTTALEHSSIIKHSEILEDVGKSVVRLPASSSGRVDIDDLKERLRGPVALVSIQWVNNETGVIQPVAEIVELCRTAGVPVHADGAQAVGKMKIDVMTTAVDYLTITAHKLNGPQGVGALYIRDKKRLLPQLWGGDQESGLRAGTENVPAIVGMGVAARIRGEHLDDAVRTLRGLRDRFEEVVLKNMPGVKTNGDADRRICNTSNLLFDSVDGQALVARLDQAGIRVSQSSACTNQRPEPSYVLRAMGLTEEEAYSSVRFSFSVLNTMEEAEFAAAKVIELGRQIRDFSDLIPDDMTTSKAN